MDGNGRWAARRHLPRVAGHQRGVQVLRQCVQRCIHHGVSVLTVFAFSSENWSRPAQEVNTLMEILAHALSREVGQLHEHGVALHFVGDRSGLPEKTSQAMAQAQLLTQSNRKMVLNVCFNYGGRWDVAQAAAAVQAKGLAMTESNLQAAMGLAHVPDPDLLIRTGGELRLSNFLLWQAAYSELYFTDTLWPDFDDAALDAAISDFSTRERRFGKVAAVSNAAAPYSAIA